MANVSAFLALICFAALGFSVVFYEVSGLCDDYQFGLEDGHCYKCRCSSANSCDEQRGVCSNGRCTNEFAGTSCQYITTKWSSLGDLYPKVVDTYPNTCNRSPRRSNFPIAFNVNGKASWTDVIALKTRTATSGLGGVDFRVIYYDQNNQSETLSPYMAQPNDTLITFRLRRPAQVTKVELHVDDDVTLGLCELFGFGGRNLAFRKNATQRPETRYGADKAVDGNTENDWYKCANTLKDRSWWRVSLGYNLLIWRIKVYRGKLGDNPEQLAGFVVNVTLHNGTEVEEYRNMEHKAKKVTDIILDRPVPAANVTIWHDKEEILTLCEVEIFGDCLDGYFGWECDKMCRCANSSEVCDKIWGNCSRSGCQAGYGGLNCSLECKPGYYGNNCSELCSRCKDNSCDRVTGNCNTSCERGWEGPGCKEKCSHGLYGDGCASNCSSGCKNNSCDHDSGACSSGCAPGYREDSCTKKCWANKYGDNCSNQCSSSCWDGLCHHVTGVCHRCQPGLQGDFCNQTCTPGYFGADCTAKCSSGCEDGLCHHLNGDCLSGCAPGWLGDFCNNTCDRGFHGYNCSLMCSYSCLKNSCDATSGRCLIGCKQGMMGARCDEVQPVDEEDVPWLLIGCLIGGVLLLIAVAIPVIVYLRYPRRKPNQTDDTDNSHALLMDSLDSPNIDDNRTDHQDAGEDRQIDNSCLYSQPNKDRKRGPEAEVDQPASDARQQREADSTAPGSAVDKSEVPTPKPRTKKPELLTLFSRDASLDPPPTEDEPSSLSKEGLVTSGGQSQTPKNQKSTPTLSRKGASFESLDTLSVDDIDIDCVQSPSSRSHRANDYCNVVLPSQSSSSPQARRVKEDYYNVVHRDTSPTTTIPLVKLPARVAQWLENPRYFSKQKEMLPAGKLADWKTALIPENLRKNRYRDIFPYDHSRVKLDPLPGIPHSDFYNACYIEGYEKEKEYIAAQGPMERTLYDFLRLVWDVKCSRIVMLTNTVELGRFKCWQYWPAEEVDLTSEDITVRLSSVITFADYCIRLLTFERGGESRTVTMYHYTAWPDNFAPASPWSLLDFRQHVRQGACDDAPVIVHCSAGIGRTGTFLALDILLTRGQHCPDVDVFTCVWKLRQQRIHMVQTLAQYIFIHETLSASLLTSVPVPVEEFLRHCKKGLPDVEKEFAQLQRCLGPEKHERNDSTPPDVLEPPSDLHRVHIVSVPGGPSPAYINAVHMSNYSHHQGYIQTHSPVDEGGAICFLSMLVQHHVTCIVCLDPDQTDTYPYYPEVKDTTVQVGSFTVTLVSKQTAPDRLVSTLRVGYPSEHTSEQGEKDESAEDWQEVTHIICTAWPPSRQTPPSTSVMLDLLEVTKPETVGTAIIYCRDGYSKSGLFCTAASVMERLRVEGRVAVSYVTAHMRVPRRQNIVNEEQYRFLYECVQHRISEETASRGTEERSAEGENLYGNIGDLAGAGDALPVRDGDDYEAMKLQDSACLLTVGSSSNGEFRSPRSPDQGYFDMTGGLARTVLRQSEASANAEESLYGNTQASPAEVRHTEKGAGKAEKPAVDDNMNGNTTDTSNATSSTKGIPGNEVSALVKNPTTDENLYGNTIDISATSKSAGKSASEDASVHIEDPSTNENIYGNTMSVSAVNKSGKGTSGPEESNTKDASADENLYGNISTC